MSATPDAAEIAGHLTKAQRAALLAFKFPQTVVELANGWVSVREWARAKDLGVPERALSAMNGLGGVDPKTMLCGPILVTPDWCREGCFYAMTDLGLAVRAALQPEAAKNFNLGPQSGVRTRS